MVYPNIQGGASGFLRVSVVSFDLLYKMLVKRSSNVLIRHINVVLSLDKC